MRSDSFHRSYDLLNTFSLVILSVKNAVCALYNPIFSPFSQFHQTLCRKDRQRNPYNQKADKASRCERLFVNDDAGKKLQRRSEVLKQAQCRQSDQARAGGKEKQRQGRHHASHQQKHVFIKMEMAKGTGVLCLEIKQEKRGR